MVAYATEQFPELGDPFGAERVEHVTANAGDVGGRSFLHLRPAGRGEMGVRRSLEHDARSTQPILTMPSSRRVSPLGESCSACARSHIRMRFSSASESHTSTS
jgi:hypothetical protein